MELRWHCTWRIFAYMIFTALWLHELSYCTTKGYLNISWVLLLEFRVCIQSTVGRGESFCSDFVRIIDVDWWLGFKWQSDHIPFVGRSRVRLHEMLFTFLLIDRKNVDLEAPPPSETSWARSDRHQCSLRAVDCLNDSTTRSDVNAVDYIWWATSWSRIH